MCLNEINVLIMKRFLLIIVAAAIAVSASANGGVYSKLSIGDYGIDNIWPAGMTAITGAVWVEIDNAGEGFKVSQIKGTVYREGQPFITGSANDVHIAKGKGKYTISGQAGLCPNVSILSILRMFLFDPNIYSVDMSVVVTTDSGKTQTLSVERLPVKTLLKIK